MILKPLPSIDFPKVECKTTFKKTEEFIFYVQAHNAKNVLEASETAKISQENETSVLKVDDYEDLLATLIMKEKKVWMRSF